MDRAAPGVNGVPEEWRLAGRRAFATPPDVMVGLGPTIHDFFPAQKDVDGRDERDHDGRVNANRRETLYHKFCSRSMRWAIDGWVAKRAQESASKCRIGFSI